MGLRARVETARRRIAGHPRRRWLALAVVASGMWLSVVNISIVNIALPDIAADLGIDLPSVGWVVTGFLITQATLLPVAGRAGDLYGRRRVFMTGVSILFAGSVLCALSWNAASLIGFRIVQAVGASAMAPTAYGYTTDLFGARERGTAMGVLGGAIGLAPVVALNIAGGLVATFGWRSVFWFSPIICVVVLAGAVLVLPEMRAGAATRSFDVPGAVLAAAGLFGLLFGLSRGEAWGFASPRVLGAFGLGAVGLAGFVWWERRASEPLFDLALFRLRSLATSNVAAGASAAALFGTLILLPFYLTRVLGYGPVGLGIAITPVALSFVVVAPLAGRAMGRVGAGRMATAGFAVAAAGALWMALVAPAQSYAELVPGIVAFGVGLAMATSPITTTAMSEVPPERVGVAAALPNIFRYTGGGLGVAVLGVLMDAALPPGVERGTRRAIAPVRDLVSDGFRQAMIAAVAFLVLAALVATLMPRHLPEGAPAAVGQPAVVE
jgi:EmrB/QacA subfamily drug resistance transporter